MLNLYSYISNFVKSFFKKENNMLNEKQKKMREIAEQEFTKTDVQPGYPDWANIQAGAPKQPGAVKNLTWCNRCAYRIATALGGNMKPFLEEKGIEWTTANAMFNNGSKNAESVHPEQAQLAANQGAIILAASFNSKGSGHVAIVMPDITPFDVKKGPYVAEAGEVCRFAYCYEAFEKWGFTPKFFVVPLIK